MEVAGSQVRRAESRGSALAENLQPTALERFVTAALVLGESVSLEQLIGGAVILAGLAIVSGVGLRSRKPSDAAAGS